ncbi:uncharacterized protein LOC107495478 [Arachis duranensis]|uniref:Uncharacterized protein LOC107495478 n=1 Tax=Arachis duranensis TaxID=130453 RepID=A0A6P4DTR1_ARADU|nr:uncharacterized protein LOC107495478 [Arachis duranensis]
MEGLLKEIQKSKTSKRKVSFNEEDTNEIEDAIDEAIAQEEQQTPSQLPTKEVIGGDPKKKAKTIIPPIFAPRTTPGSQPSLKSVFQNKKALHEVDKRLARWLLDYMLDGITGIGPGYKGPSYDKLRVNLLADLKRECQIVVDSYRSAWKETGCTLMANVTYNAANYVAAGRLINKKLENIHWSPCVAHYLNLILKDISSMPHISNLATSASKITVFVYNHMSNFECKSNLQALVVDTHFTEYKLRSANGRAVSAIILDNNKFWDDCFTACKIVSSLIKLLRLVDADDKPSLEIVYEDEIDADLDQGGGGGSSTFYVAPLAFSGPSSGNEGDDINDANLQQLWQILIIDDKLESFYV